MQSDTHGTMKASEGFKIKERIVVIKELDDIMLRNYHLYFKNLSHSYKDTLERIESKQPDKYGIVIPDTPSNRFTCTRWLQITELLKKEIQRRKLKIFHEYMSWKN